MTEISALSVAGVQAKTVAIVATSKAQVAGVILVLDTLTPLLTVKIENIDDFF